MNLLTKSDYSKLALCLKPRPYKGGLIASSIKKVVPRASAVYAREVAESAIQSVLSATVAFYSAPCMSSYRANPFKVTLDEVVLTKAVFDRFLLKSDKFAPQALVFAGSIVNSFITHSVDNPTINSEFSVRVDGLGRLELTIF